MTRNEAVEKVKALLTPETWVNYLPQQTPQHCLLTALYAVWREDDTISRWTMLEDLRRQIPGPSVQRWNDAPERTLAEVHAALDAIKDPSDGCGIQSATR